MTSDKWQPIETAPTDGTKVLVIEYDQSTYFRHIGPTVTPLRYEPHVAWLQDTSEKRIVPAPELGEETMKWQKGPPCLKWVTGRNFLPSTWKIIKPTHWLPIPEFPAIPES